MQPATRALHHAPTPWIRCWAWAFLFTISSIASAREAFLNLSDYANLRVVVAPDARETERYAAREFAKYWEESTGHPVPIGTAPVDGNVHVWIGSSAKGFLKSGDLKGLGDDGVLIRSHGGTTKDLILSGGPKRGALYAVYQFFEDRMGLRWLTPDLTHVPKAPSHVRPISFRYAPPFAYRDVSYRAFVNNPEFAVAHRLNGYYSKIPESMGGHMSYMRGHAGYGHTFHFFVPPKTYFETHPEYFAEITGTRRKEAQLCLTNQDVLEITIAKVKKLLGRAPAHKRIVSVSQMDYHWFDSWCTCVNCKRVDANEESHAGTVIHFVNKVAEAIENDFPDAFIDTFAYMYSRKPPKHVRPRDNVIVRLCSIEGDFGRPLSDRGSGRNRAFRRDLARWGRIAKNLFVFDYTQNWYSHQGPHPNFHVLQPNARLFMRHGVRGVVEHASWTSPHSDYEYLKGYLLAKSLWNPKGDWTEWYDEFLRLYYGEAAPFIGEYITLITDKVRRDGVELTFVNKMEWMDYYAVIEAEAIFRRASRVVRDPVIAERLRYAHLPVQYAALVCPPKITLEDGVYHFDRPPSQSFSEYWDMIMSYGVTHLEDSPIERFRERLGGETPPRHQEFPVEVLENDLLRVWVLPEAGGAIVRLTHKASGYEFVPGYEHVLEPEESWGDWAQLPGSAFPIRTPYRVIGKGERFLHLQTPLDNGLELSRVLELDPVEASLSVTVNVKNTGPESVAIAFTFGGAVGRAGRKGRWVHDAGVEEWRYKVPRSGLRLRASTAGVGESLRFKEGDSSHASRFRIGRDQSEIGPGEIRRSTWTFQIED